MSKHKQSGTPAIRTADKLGLAYTLIEYEHSDHSDEGYALDTARVLGREPSTIFKTLMTFVDGKPTCALVPATGMLNLKSLARAAGGKKAEMMPPDKAEKLTGYVTGGISPLGQRSTSPTYIDESAREHETILVSGGKRTLSLEVSADELARLIGATFAPLADIGRHA